MWSVRGAISKLTSATDADLSRSKEEKLTDVYIEVFRPRPPHCPDAIYTPSSRDERALVVPQLAHGVLQERRRSRSVLAR